MEQVQLTIELELIGGAVLGYLVAGLPGGRAMRLKQADFAEGSILGVAADLVAARKPFALVVVIGATRSTSARPDDKAVFDTERTVSVGRVGRRCAGSTIANAAIECLKTSNSQVIELDPDDEVLGAGLPCGGNMQVCVEPVIPRPTIWILGHGRLGECLCHIGSMKSFNVVLDDVSTSCERYPDATRVISNDNDCSALAPDFSDFVVIATQHRGDHESLRRLPASDVGYIGLIASHKRTGLVIDYLREAVFGQADIERIRAPAGLAPGARTPEEIALSIHWRDRSHSPQSRDARQARWSPPHSKRKPESSRAVHGEAATHTSSRQVKWQLHH